jgi:hypothetical protein
MKEIYESTGTAKLQSVMKASAQNSLRKCEKGSRHIIIQKISTRKTRMKNDAGAGIFFPEKI